MKVCDILRVKGSTLFTVAPETALQTAVLVMSEHDIGSLVVMEYGDLVGMLTFREVIAAVEEFLHYHVTGYRGLRSLRCLEAWTDLERALGRRG